ncbi:MAG: tyrosine-protein phosphatase [Prevotella sp.]|nr:tyrosine-protein phosphatase [Prevotella sp.]
MNNRIFITVFSALLLNIKVLAQQPLLRDYSIDIENDVVSRFIREVTYQSGDSSCVADYYKDVGGFFYHPQSLVIDLPESETDTLVVVCHLDTAVAGRLTFRVPTARGKASLHNFIPGLTYNYEVMDGEQMLQFGNIVTTGQVRMLNIDGQARSIRDLGGWTTEDGRQRIKYGRLIRGSELNWEYPATDEGLRQLLEIGVGAEIDMRAHRDAEAHSNGQPELEGVSVFGFTDAASTPDDQVPTYLYTNDSGMLPSNMSSYTWLNRWRQEFQFIIANLRQERNIYIHCIYGQDRTGYLSLLLEGLLGVGYSDLIKEYELTPLGTRSVSKKAEIDRVIAFINRLSGATLRDKFETYFRNYILINQSDIDYFRSVMLEDVEIKVVTEVDQLNVSSNNRNNRVYDLMGRPAAHRQAGGFYVLKNKKIKE